MLLTPEERDRFASYLEQEARVAAQIIGQMEKMAGMELLLKKEKSERAAAIIIAHKLRTIENA